MKTIEIILSEGLARLVAGSARTRPKAGPGSLRIRRRLAEATSIKDAVEAVGVPHCEIGEVRRLEPGGPGDSLDLGKPVRDGDVLEVRPQPPRSLAEPRFLCDRHLGKLARLLRILGFDTLWSDSWTEPEIVRRGVNEQRLVLSRSRALLKRKEMDRAQLIVSDDPDVQAAEVLRRWLLAGQARLFGRCSRCNGALRPVAKAEVAARIPPKTARWLDEYYLCGDCDQLFWKGTHVTALTGRLERILAPCGGSNLNGNRTGGK